MKKKETILNGIQGKRILCLANLRPQKNHFMLIDVAKKVKNVFPEWSFHLVGKDFNDDYSGEIKKKISQNYLQNQVYIYGSKKDIQNIINQSEIGVLTSSSEGLPVCLLEFGLMEKPVIATNVGEIPTILKNKINGFLIESKKVNLFSQAVLELIKDNNLIKTMGKNLNHSIVQSHSKNIIIKKYVVWLNEISKC